MNDLILRLDKHLIFDIDHNPFICIELISLGDEGQDQLESEIHITREDIEFLLNSSYPQIKAK